MSQIVYRNIGPEIHARGALHGENSFLNLWHLRYGPLCVECPEILRRTSRAMIVTNTETVAGYDIVAIRGLVQGNTVRAKHAGRDIAAGLKNLLGGELRGYTELLTESRREAMERMLAQAQQLEANAVVNVRFTTSAVTAGAAELYAYGTAVSVEPSQRW